MKCTSLVTKAQTYWSVENNSLGEAALIVIEEMDEDKFQVNSCTNPRSEVRGRSNSVKVWQQHTKQRLQHV